MGRRQRTNLFVDELRSFGGGGGASIARYCDVSPCAYLPMS